MCECKDCDCGATESSCCGKAATSGECGTQAQEFLDLAKSAHRELLKEKMKKIFEAKIGKKMDQVAEVVVDTALAGLQQKMAEKQAFDLYKETLMAVFKG